ncbi:MAG: transposase [Prevotella sp.]|nr:transposase [Prevotella sp.]
MARNPRVVSGTGIYHVMMRGINRQNIFEDTDDYIRFREILLQMVNPTDKNRQPLPARCTFYAYCLMTNHVHLLIRENAESIGEVIKRIGISYAKHYNRKYQHFGHLFQDRYKSEPVNDAAYFFTLLRYIHQNPVAAGITKNVNDYEWSSWNEYERASSCIPIICNVSHVFARMPLAELKELVNEPLPKTTMILDYDSGDINRSDEEVKEFLSVSFGLRQPSDIQLYSRERRNDIIRAAKLYGASIRQLVRLTGISFSIIRTA